LLPHQVNPFRGVLVRVRIRHLLLVIWNPIEVGAVRVHWRRIHHHLTLHLLIHLRGHPYLVLLHELSSVRRAIHLPTGHLLLIHPHLVFHVGVIALVGRTPLDRCLAFPKKVGIILLLFTVLLVIPLFWLFILLNGSHILLRLVMNLPRSRVKGLFKVHQVHSTSLFHFINSYWSIVNFLEVGEDTQDCFSVHRVRGYRVFRQAEDLQLAETLQVLELHER